MLFLSCLQAAAGCQSFSLLSSCSSVTFLPSCIFSSLHISRLFSSLQLLWCDVLTFLHLFFSTYELFVRLTFYHDDVCFVLMFYSLTVCCYFVYTYLYNKINLINSELIYSTVFIKIAFHFN